MRAAWGDASCLGCGASVTCGTGVCGVPGGLLFPYIPLPTAEAVGFPVSRPRRAHGANSISFGGVRPGKPKLTPLGMTACVLVPLPESLSPLLAVAMQCVFDDRKGRLCR